MPNEISVLKDDAVLALLSIDKKARSHGFEEIVKKANHLLGKRLLKLEIELNKKCHEEVNAQSNIETPKKIVNRRQVFPKQINQRF